MTISYHPLGDEELVFRQAFNQHLPLLIKGPTGCGKTRFVEYMAQQLKLPMWTVACNEDTSASDLVGRYILKGNETPWIDGPLTQAVRQGGICYLDEVIEARQEALVVLNALADHRRQLFIDKTNEVCVSITPTLNSSSTSLPVSPVAICRLLEHLHSLVQVLAKWPVAVYLKGYQPAC